MALTQCESCNIQTVDTCSDTATLITGLNPATQYTVFMQDKFDTIYKQTITSNGSGNLVLDLDAVDLAFTPYSGDYLITISTSADTNTTESLTIAGGTYNCINMSFYNSN